jgi:hypothetical protein
MMGTVCGIGDWGWTRVPYPIVLLRLKDIDNNVKSDVDSDDGSNKEENNDGHHSTRYWGWTRVPYPVVLLRLKTS